MNREEFHAAARETAGAFEAFVKGKELSGFIAADHLSYRAAKAEEFVAVRALLETEELYLYQSMLSARRIAIVGLRDPIPTCFGPIKYLELADQKPDRSQKSGFDHVEVVPKEVSYEEMIASAKAAGLEVVEKTRPHHTAHDIEIGDGLIFRFSREALIERIKREEFV